MSTQPLTYNEMNLDNKLHAAFILSVIFMTGFCISDAYYQTVAHYLWYLLLIPVYLFIILVESSRFLNKYQPDLGDIFLFGLGTWSSIGLFIVYLTGAILV